MEPGNNKIEPFPTFTEERKIPEDIGDCIRRARLDANMSIDELAKASMISPAQLKRYESSELYGPPCDVLSRILQVLGKTTFDVFGLEDSYENEADFDQLANDPTIQSMHLLRDVASALSGLRDEENKKRKK